MNIYPRKNRRLPLGAVLILYISVISCSSTKNKDLAEQGVVQFRSQLDSEGYHAMYVAADEDLRKISSETDFVALMQEVHQKLGKIQQSKERSFQVSWFARGGAVVTLFYNTKFAGGQGDEKFVWRIQNDRPVLLGYDIESDVLASR
jgi:hypothetical protein